MIIRAIRRDIVALQESEEAQRRHADELEATVEARTRELRAVNAQLEAASRHKSEFLTHMSHELRTPLNAILGFSELLRSPAFGPLNEQQARHLNHIRASGRHLLIITNDLLDLAKVEAGKIELYPEPFDIDKVLMAVLGDLQPMADQKRLVLTTYVEPDMLPLTADPVRFKQILYNLLSNAIKFTPEGGHVTVTARVRREASGVRREEGPLHPTPYTLPPAGDSVEIAVTDTGIGIAEENLVKLFQPFTQLDFNLARQYHGTGLGLALTKQLVELHNGRIWATSEGRGRGSSFIIRFPLGAAGAVFQESLNTEPVRAEPPDTVRLQPVGGTNSGAQDALVEAPLTHPSTSSE
ncbi:MAG: ATP-binding protein [Candidatus Methylomirabilis sp.]|nr:ATP-binding protein [Candidatus Methylomirabilis sp.]